MSFLLVLSFMVHSGYVNATTMTCFGTGRVEVSLTGDDFCCAPISAEEESVSPKCCGFEVTEKVFNSFSDNGFEFAVSLIQLPKSAKVFELSEFWAQAVEFESLTSPPKSLHGISLLKIISVFRL